MYENRRTMYETQSTDYQYFAKSKIPVHLNPPTYRLFCCKILRGGMRRPNPVPPNQLCSNFMLK